LGRLAFSLSEERIIHEREAYSLLEVVGDFGGV
jgi:hypothetical protein